MARSPLICTIAPLCIYGGYFFRRSKISGISFLYGFLDSGDLPEFPFNKFTHSLIDKGEYCIKNVIMAYSS